MSTHAFLGLRHRPRLQRPSFLTPTPHTYQMPDGARRFFNGKKWPTFPEVPVFTERFSLDLVLPGRLCPFCLLPLRSRGFHSLTPVPQVPLVFSSSLCSDVAQETGQDLTSKPTSQFQQVLLLFSSLTLGLQHFILFSPSSHSTALHPSFFLYHFLSCVLPHLRKLTPGQLLLLSVPASTSAPSNTWHTRLPACHVSLDLSR